MSRLKWRLGVSGRRLGTLSSTRSFFFLFTTGFLVFVVGLFVGWNDMSCHCGGMRPPWYDMAWRDVVWLVRLAVIIALGTQVVN